MGRTEGALLEKWCVTREFAADAIDFGDLDRFVTAHGRQNRGHGTRHQGLARTRNASKQDVVPTCRRDLQCASDMLLAADLAKIHWIVAVGRDLWCLPNIRGDV